jgi:hypothetical protein
MVMVMRTSVRVAASDGQVMYQNRFQPAAPSMPAAS